MAGFANRVVRIGFPELTEPDEPELFLILRNPKVVSPDEFASSDVAVGPDGQPLNPEDAAERSREIIARLVVTGRMYDATDMGVDMETGELTDQKLLTYPLTKNTARCLPVEVMQKIGAEIGAAFAPK